MSHIPRNDLMDVLSSAQVAVHTESFCMVDPSQLHELLKGLEEDTKDIVSNSQEGSKDDKSQTGTKNKIAPKVDEKEQELEESLVVQQPIESPKFVQPNSSPIPSPKQKSEEPASVPEVTTPPSQRNSHHITKVDRGGTLSLRHLITGMIGKERSATQAKQLKEKEKQLAEREAKVQQKEAELKAKEREILLKSSEDFMPIGHDTLKRAEAAKKAIENQYHKNNMHEEESTDSSGEEIEENEGGVSVQQRVNAFKIIARNSPSNPAPQREVVVPYGGIQNQRDVFEIPQGIDCEDVEEKPVMQESKGNGNWNSNGERKDSLGKLGLTARKFLKSIGDEKDKEEKKKEVEEKRKRKEEKKRKRREEKEALKNSRKDVSRRNSIGSDRRPSFGKKSKKDYGVSSGVNVNSTANEKADPDGESKKLVRQDSRADVPLPATTASFHTEPVLSLQQRKKLFENPKGEQDVKNYGPSKLPPRRNQTPRIPPKSSPRAPRPSSWAPGQAEESGEMAKPPPPNNVQYGIPRGARVAPGPKKFCSTCGSKAGGNFCTMCGTKL